MPTILSSVKALLLHDGKYLLLKETLRKGDIWDLPGGKIEYGESPEEALHREVREELDLSIKIHRSVGVWYFFSQEHKHQVICHTFLCEPIGAVLIDTTKNPADEHFDELRWASKDELLQDTSILIPDSLRALIKSL